MRHSVTAVLVILLGLSVATATASAEPARPGVYLSEDTIFGRPVTRGGLHFQVAFGFGGGPDSVGVFHAMELGWTLSGGTTLGMIHSFIQNKDVLSDRGGPDLFGGWMFLYKVPLFYPELVFKAALGPGGTHDQSDGITANWGLGWLYGLDLHLPSFRTSGPTLSLVALHAVAQGAHHVGFSLGLGYTFF